MRNPYKEEALRRSGSKCRIGKNYKKKKTTEERGEGMKNSLIERGFSLDDGSRKRKGGQEASPQKTF